MGNLFLQFYTRNLVETGIFLIVFTLISGFLGAKYRGNYILKLVSGLLLSAWLAAVLYETVLSRTPSEQKKEFLYPFASYVKVFHGANRELLRSNYMNVLLFYPGGVFYGLIGTGQNQKKHQLLRCGFVFFILSCGIEFMQYQFRLGIPECDDLIHNTLGAVLGFTAIRYSHPAAEKVKYIIRKLCRGVKKT